MSIEKKTSAVINRFREARESLGLTLRQVADATGYAITTVSGVEYGLHKPSTHYVKDFVLALGLNLNWLLFGEGAMRESAADASPTALLLSDLESAKTETNALKAELRDMLSLALGRLDAIDGRIEEMDKLVRQKVKPIKVGSSGHEDLNTDLADTGRLPKGKLSAMAGSEQGGATDAKEGYGAEVKDCSAG